MLGPIPAADPETARTLLAAALQLDTLLDTVEDAAQGVSDGLGSVNEGLAFTAAEATDVLGALHPEAISAVEFGSLISAMDGSRPLSAEEFAHYVEALSGSGEASGDSASNLLERLGVSNPEQFMPPPPIGQLRLPRLTMGDLQTAISNAGASVSLADVALILEEMETQSVGIETISMAIEDSTAGGRATYEELAQWASSLGISSTEFDRATMISGIDEICCANHIEDLANSAENATELVFSEAFDGLTDEVSGSIAGPLQSAVERLRGLGSVETRSEANEVVDAVLSSVVDARQVLPRLRRFAAAGVMTQAILSSEEVRNKVAESAIHEQSQFRPVAMVGADYAVGLFDASAIYADPDISSDVATAIGVSLHDWESLLERFGDDLIGVGVSVIPKDAMTDVFIETAAQDLTEIKARAEDMRTDFGAVGTAILISLGTGFVVAFTMWGIQSAVSGDDDNEATDPHGGSWSLTLGQSEFEGVTIEVPSGSSSSGGSSSSDDGSDSDGDGVPDDQDAYPDDDEESLCGCCWWCIPLFKLTSQTPKKAGTLP